MKLIYIAGPFSGKTAWAVACNVHRAEYLAAQVIERNCGWFPIVPHSLGARFDGHGTYEYWLEGTLDLLRKCDAVLMVSGWERSKGATGEKLEAERLGLPVYLSFDDWQRSVLPPAVAQTEMTI